MHDPASSAAPASAPGSGSAASAARHFSVTLRRGKPRQGVLVLPFEPDAVWGRRTRHLLIGTVGGHNYRGAVETVDGEPAILLGPAWLRDRPDVVIGDTVEASLWPEGPQRSAASGAGGKDGGIDPDIAEALAAEPEAAAFWDGLAQFYRKAYVTWITATKKRPDERVRRIAETVRLLKAGVKQR
ncbi:hypothetical protein DB346_24215 [Verrucomicrobia bacterium LW23]|nr:hypothetical protein DB346_24215 [Verrucomicrobia bacterium LW23]